MIKLSLQEIQFSELIAKLDEGQAGLAVALADLNTKLNTLIAVVNEEKILLQQIRDNTGV